MTLALLMALILAHLSGPPLAEAPMVSECQRVEARVKKLEALELWAIRNGVVVLMNGRVVKK